MPSTVSDVIDGLSTSVAVKAPCATVALTNITLAGLQTISGVPGAEGLRTLCVGQADQKENGIYEQSTGQWQRTHDADGKRDLVQGTRFLVRNTGVDGVEYELTSANPIVIGTSALTFVLRYGANATYDQTAFEIAAGVVPTNRQYQPGDVRRYGAILDGVINDTLALNKATAATAGTGVPVVIPYGTLLVTPNTAQVGAATYNCACALLSNTSYVGYNGATIKVSNNYSTDGTPKELAVFSTSVPISFVLFRGLTWDMNGANNKMSPARPATYNQFNHAAIMANGAAGLINNCTIEDCTLKNNAGVCFIVCALVAAGTTPTMGKTWKILNCLFLNGGTDTNDHTSIYAWAEDVLCEGCTFWQDNPPHTVGKTGGATCYEIHGANQRFVNNFCFNYTLGLYVAPNFTSPTVGSIVALNHFYCSDYGILIWREITPVVYAALDDILISTNWFNFDNYTYSGQPLYKAAVAYQGQLPTAQGAVNDVKITNNIARNTGNTLLSYFVKWDTASVAAAQKGAGLFITGNNVRGFTVGVQIITNALNGMGLTEIINNPFLNLTPDSLANPPIGIYINATGAGVDTLKIDANSFTDDRGGGASFATAIFFTAGTIADLWLGSQLYKGLTAANFNNASTTITRQIGPAFEQGATNVADGGTIAFNGNHAGLTPRSIICTGSVAGEFVSVTTFGATTFTVAIKKWTGGALTAGTNQTVYWRVQF